MGVRASWGFGRGWGFKGVGSSGCSGKGRLGCLKVWMGSEVLEGSEIFGGGGRVWEVGGV